MPAAKKAAPKVEEQELVGDLVEFAAEPQPEDLLDDALFLGPAEDTSHHILAGEAIPEPQVDHGGVDRRYVSPERSIKGSAEVAAVSGDSFFQAMQDKLVAQAVDRLIKEHGSTLLQQLGSIPVEMQAPSVPPPPSYKKHYRCDTHPDLQILALDMKSLEYGERPQANPIPGQWIKFRRGHLYTSDDNEIAQIEWMKSRPATSPDGQTTLGGNPSIYEDDGGDIFRCTAGCDYITASKNAWKAHMAATHNITVN